MIKVFNVIYDLLIFIYAVILKIFTIFYRFKKIPIVARGKKNIIIIANGPSLKKNLKIFKKKKKKILNICFKLFCFKQRI